MIYGVRNGRRKEAGENLGWKFGLQKRIRTKEVLNGKRKVKREEKGILTIRRR